MLSYRFTPLLLASLLGLSACGGDSTHNSSESAPINDITTYVVFSPATGELPIPSDLQFSAEVSGDGTMYVSDDPSNPVITGIDSLDGNSVLAPFDITFSESLDTTQELDAASFVISGESVLPNPNQNVFLLPLAYPSGDGLNPTGLETPTFAEAASYLSAVASSDVTTLTALASPTARAEIISLDGGTNNVLRINPLQPLAAKTKYLVVVTNVRDANGENVLPSTAYEFLKDPESNVEQFGLTSLRTAIIGWETLAAGYFSFMQGVFDSASVSASAPTADDIIFSLTFTTGGTTDVLNSLAAPELFFENSLSANYKFDAIGKLVNGAYSVSGETTLTDSPVDIQIAATMNVLLTSPILPEIGNNQLYDASIAAAIEAGASYSDIISGNASAGYILQRAAVEAALSVHDGDGTPIATEAIGAVQAIAAANEGTVSDVFPLPAARTSNFYRQDSAAELSGGLLPAPARIYQGEINLPYYLPAPTAETPTLVQTGAWLADESIGSALDTLLGNAPATTPPSNKTTYRYPFPTEQSEQTVPLVVTTPDEATLGLLGITKPEGGWPVIIFVHGITSERSSSLPMANALAFACVALDDEGNPAGPSGLPCYATVAIDQPLHGIAPAGSQVPGLTSVSAPDFSVESNIGDNTPSLSLGERHFNVTADATNTATAMTYDPDFGSSGSLFINLLSFVTARDNARQMNLDLLNVNASIASMDLDDNPDTADLDPANVYLIGHSLGGITGLPFVAVNNYASTQASPFSDQPFIKAAAGLTTGGGQVRLLTNSPSFSPTILQGLAAASDALTQGNSGLESYLNVFQGILDSSDLTNFASTLSDQNSSTGILLAEVIGDTTIPNAADETLWGTPPLSTTVPDTGFVIDQFPAPLAATEPMAAEFGAIKTALVDDSDDGDADVIITRYTAGSHSTPVSADDIAVFSEMVSQIAIFFAADGDVSGTGIELITNSDVIEE